MDSPPTSYSNNIDVGVEQRILQSHPALVPATAVLPVAVLTATAGAGTTSRRSPPASPSLSPLPYISQPSPPVQPRDNRATKPRFECSEPGCFRTFNRKYTLGEHQKTHTGEKPHACPVQGCGKRFTTSGNLSRHKRTHGTLLPLPCPVPGCICSFANDTKLAKHMKFHLGTTEHLCLVPQCGKTFSTFGNYNRHLRNHHTHDERLLASDPCRRNVTSASNNSVRAEVDTSTFVHLVGRRRHIVSPSDSDDLSRSSGSSAYSSSDDDTSGTSALQHRQHYNSNSIARRATRDASTEPVVLTDEPRVLTDEPRAPWNAEMLEALALILDTQLVVP